MAMLLSVLSQIGIDKTFFYQFVLVVLVYFCLSRFMFIPILRTIISRDEKTEGLKIKADEILLEHDAYEKEYQKLWMEYVKKADAEKQKIYSRTNDKASEIIQNSDKHASTLIKKGRHEVDTKVNKAKSDLNNYSAGIKKDIKVRLLEN